MFTRAVELTPTGDIGRHFMVVTLVLEGRAADAVRLLDRPSSTWQLQDEALVYHALGDARRAQRALDALIATASEAAAFQIAEVYAWRGDRERAFHWLDRAFAQRDAGLSELRSSTLLRGLRGDPRFVAMLRKVNLPADPAGRAPE